MCPRGSEDPLRVYEIGRMYIANVGGSAVRGDYDAVVCRRGTSAVPSPLNPGGPSPTRAGRVEDYPRLAYNMWRLIIRAALSCFPEERKRAAKPGNDDPSGDPAVEPTEEQALELGVEMAAGMRLSSDDQIELGRAAWLRGARSRGF